MEIITPQEPTVNRNVWRLLEVKVCDGSYRYVITGAVYSYPAKTVGKHAVPVPVSYYKLVYTADGKVQAYEAENKPNSPVVDSTLEAVQKKSGIVFLAK